MFPATTQRVQNATSDEVTRDIQLQTEERVANYRHAPLEQIDHRLRELDEEWDVERILEANASALALTGCVLAATSDRRWLALPIAVTGFLMQHALQGWCPPLPVIRRLGFRTPREIEHERQALKVLRGDYEQVGPRARDAAEGEVLRAVSR